MAQKVGEAGGVDWVYAAVSLVEDRLVPARGFVGLLLSSGLCPEGPIMYR